MRFILLILVLGLVACSPSGDSGTPIPGPIGPQGIPGLAGSPAPSPSPVSLLVVKLCTPKHDDLYPTQALCIDSKLYAVVDGRFIELKPGLYQTDDCTFQVKPDCTVNSIKH